MEINLDYRKKIHNESLQEISGIKFTLREIDIIACILHNRGEKKIGSLLGISYRTVSSHVRNIMSKFNCNSRDCIIDEIEKSGKLQYFKQYYFHLILHGEFEKQLEKIGNLINRSGTTCSSDFTTTNQEEHNLLQQITKHLSLANVTLISKQEKSEHIQNNLCIVNNSLPVKKERSDNIALLLNKEVDSKLFEKLEYINFTDSTNYYLSILLLLKKIIAKPELTEIIEEFRDKQTALKHSLENTNIVMVKHTITQHKHKSVRIILMICTLMLLVWIFVKQTTAIIEDESNKSEKWHLPLPQEHYTEREEITKIIWEKFNTKDKNKTALFVGLHGLGGVGKTTLATNIIHYPEQEYSFKGWFSAETENLLQADYFELGEKQHLFTKDNMSAQQKIELVKEWLQQQKHVLLVYDNVPDMRVIEKLLPDKGHIIITSRNYNLPSAIEVDVMKEKEALRLLDSLITKAKQSETHQQDLKDLAKELGYLPLALAQAGSYIAANNISIKNYLSLYETDKDELLKDETLPSMNPHAPVYISWDISIEKLKQHKKSKEMLTLLSVISCCYSDNVPDKLLAQYLYGKTDNAAALFGRPLKLVAYQ